MSKQQIAFNCRSREVAKEVRALLTKFDINFSYVDIERDTNIRVSIDEKVAYSYSVPYVQGDAMVGDGIILTQPTPAEQISVCDGEYVCVVDNGDTAKVGCQTLRFSEVEAVFNAMKQHRQP